MSEIVVHIAAVPMEKEQRCIRCCKKLLDIDPVNRASYRALTFLAVSEESLSGMFPHVKIEIQETDARQGQEACRQRGRHS